MRLVKKTVNQDDVSAYHLYYADAHGSPGTDVTFFDSAGHLTNSPALVPSI
jgi:glyoxalase family protein